MTSTTLMTSTMSVAAPPEVIPDSSPPRQAASASAAARRSKAIVCARQGRSLFKVTFLRMLIMWVLHPGSPRFFLGMVHLR